MLGGGRFGDADLRESRGPAGRWVNMFYSSKAIYVTIRQRGPINLGSIWGKKCYEFRLLVETKVSAAAPICEVCTHVHANGLSIL